MTFLKKTTLEKLHSGGYQSVTCTVYIVKMFDLFINLIISTDFFLFKCDQIQALQKISVIYNGLFLN